MKSFILAIVITLFISLNCFADSIYVEDDITPNEHYNYMVTTDKDITIAWDNSNGYDPEVHDYEILLHNPEREYDVTLGLTDETTYTFKCPKTGHWIPKVRVVWVEDGETRYTDFASSDDATIAKVGEENKSWWIFAWIAKTGGIIIPEENNSNFGNY